VGTILQRTQAPLAQPGCYTRSSEPAVLATLLASLLAALALTQEPAPVREIRARIEPAEITTIEIADVDDVNLVITVFAAGFTPQFEVAQADRPIGRSQAVSRAWARAELRSPTGALALQIVAEDRASGGAVLIRVANAEHSGLLTELQAYGAFLGAQFAGEADALRREWILTELIACANRLVVLEAFAAAQRTLEPVDLEHVGAQFESLALRGRALLAASYAYTGEPLRARDELERVRADWEGLAARDRIEPFVLRHLGALTRELGDHEASLDVFTRLGELATQRGSSGLRVLALAHIARVYALLDEEAAAREFADLSQTELAALSADPLAANALDELTATMHALGDRERGRQLAQRAFASSSGPARLIRGVNLINDLLEAGAFESASDLAERCVQDLAAGTPEHVAALVYAQAAHVAAQRGDYDRGYALALEALRGNGLETRKARAAANLTLGVTLRLMELESEAVARFQRALTLCDELGLEGLRWGVLLALARGARERGDYAAARELDERALADARKVGDRRAIAAVRDAFAILALDEGRLEEAQRLAQSALEDLRDAGEPSDVLRPLATLARVSIAREDSQAAKNYLQRANATLTSLNDDSRGNDAQLGMRSDFADLGEIAQDLTTLVLAEAGDSDARQAALVAGFDAAEQWRGRLLLEGVRRGESPERTPVILEPTPKQHAFIAYVRGHDRLFAYMLLGDRIERFDLGSAREIDEVVRRYADDVAYPSRSLDTVVREGVQLYELLLKPILSRNSNMKHLTVAPTGQLARIPFDALVQIAAGADVRFVADDYVVSYSPSYAVWLELRRQATHAGSSILLLGDPLYAGEVGARPVGKNAAALSSVARLAGTSTEVLEVLEILLDASDGNTDATVLVDLQRGDVSSAQLPVADVYLREAATTEVLERDLAQYRVLHFATHGLVDLRDPRRTGLVLAHAAAGEGFLSLERAAALELQADLVVLSACETARGRQLRGEGIQSLATAFLHGGARAVVASLWAVSDDEAAQTMVRFYRGYVSEGLSIVESLRRAKASIRRSARPSDEARNDQAERGVGLGRGRSIEQDRRHPFYWAPFIYVGPPPSAD